MLPSISWAGRPCGATCLACPSPLSSFLELLLVPLLALTPLSHTGVAASQDLDTCAEDKVPWTDVHNAIFGYLRGHVAADKIGRLGNIALEGGLDPQDFDCMYGWITLRFFVPLVLDEAWEVLEKESFFHIEWVLWLNSPWFEMLDSPWDVPTVLAATSAALSPWQSNIEAGCSALELKLLRQVGSDSLADGAPPTAAAARLAAAVLLELPEDVLSGSKSHSWSSPCPAYAAATAALSLGLARAGFRLTPGYALRLAQKSLMVATGAGFWAFLRSPWPIAALLLRLTQHLRSVQHERADIADERIAEQVYNASVAEFSDVLPAFLPPVSRLERLRLFHGLAATHAALVTAHIPYIAMTGTLLGAARHHGFVPWDGDADLCVDIRDETRLLRLVLFQGSSSAFQEEDGEKEDDLVEKSEVPESPVAKAAAALQAAGFELFAHAARPLTFKLSGRGWSPIPGRPYRYPYIDLWFCHGWAEGQFSLQSANYGVPMPREVVFPRRKVFFAGLPLWSFRDSRSSLVNYYGGEDVFALCVGHMSFHRQERKYSEASEADRFDGRVACGSMRNRFAFASGPVPGPPPGATISALLTHLSAWLRLLPEPRWTWDPDGPASGEQVSQNHWPEIWRDIRDLPMPPLRLGQDWPEPRSIQNISTSQLVGRDGLIIHHLTEAVMLLDRPVGTRCDVLLRMRPLDEGSLDTQLLGVFAEPSHAAFLGTQLIEVADGGALRLDVPSCVCRCRHAGLRLQWVAEEPG